jgi:hypothetical protein
MMPLDFAQEREESTASWQRADPTGALIERVSWDTWLVTLPDSSTTYEVTLYEDHGALLGECRHRDEADTRCKARQFSDESEPCAHLCTVYQATLFNDPDVNGRPIETFSAEEVGLASNDTHIETAMAEDRRDPVAADGGPEVAE